ncbi:LysR family transcriptional regulator [Staphylococcus sp. IVB6181]|uniref:cidABC operon transcriptional activator CidR n=1 Tax=Staphylococcus sp. IVB6181 TaxID=2929481 RepID=UPI0021CFBAF6|nr:LysR family transcriptional regulator [Staphylococcus sp. IVB6181]UXV35426.1 LysR family transcriptional regulator [Staphylococcus sp. IVB6181]
MDIKQMGYFIAVVQYGGMTNASRELFIAQPTISKAIKDLENELGSALFDRSKRHLTLTDSGEIFYKKSLEIMNLFENLPKEVNQLKGLEAGHISIGLSAVMNMNKFIETLGNFHQLYPNITYNLVENGGKALESQIINNEIDIGITTLPVDSAIFESIPLYTEDLLLVVSETHPLADREVVEMHELANEDFILFNEDFYLNDKIIETAKRSGFVPKTISKISQWNFIENLLTAGLGVSILPENIVKMLNGPIHSSKINDTAMRWQLGVIWKKEKYINYATREYIDYMKSSLTMQD